ncbi:MAG: hypothetical protein HPY54_01320 [Chthonomonadetes bacterium]|nr:hypothetical protein [Chthonomonadetes bacterium]
MVTIERTEQGYRLLRNGEPFFIKGAVGNRFLERLVQAGGNSIRAGVKDLDTAHALGLTVLVNLPFGKPRWGFDYTDRAAVAKQMEDLRQTVQSVKDHPALLMWAIGNELEIWTTPEQREPLWRAVDEAAQMIHEVDGRHPVITPVGCDYRHLLWEIDALCPGLDAIGINAYQDMLTLPEDLRQLRWERPYVVTEFGPRGHWQVIKTPWGMPIEDSSTHKAEFYRRAYEHAVLDRPNCLGAYVFHWSFHHEKTHTWYGMFLEDGSATESVEVMQYFWTGHYPRNRCPRIEEMYVQQGDGSPQRVYATLQAGAVVQATVEASDPDGDPLSIRWELRPDVADNPNVGGDREEPVQPIAGAILDASGNRATVQMPQQAGRYRLFVYVFDGAENAATANMPLLVV